MFYNINNRTDDEGDKITVTTDDDLAISLAEMSGRVKKFSAEVTSLPDSSNSGKGPRVQWSVTCAACEKPISGFRYKCVTCPDFDLCSSCETNGAHQVAVL